MPEVLSEIVFLVANGRDQFNRQFAIGINDNGWARFLIVSPLGFDSGFRSSTHPKRLADLVRTQ